MTKKEKTIEEEYKKKQLHDHILEAPDTYIGSIDEDEFEMYYYDDKTSSILKGKKNIVLGLYKIFDEIIVNSADQTVRNSKKCNEIRVNIDKSSGIISVQNNGCEIPIAIHKEEKVYVPEMIFGTLLTSGNYDQKDKLVGGKNGFGAKLANIYSKEFSIEVVDIKRKKKYFQQFSNNMYNREEPIVNDIEDKMEAYIKTTFLPDYKKFGMKKLSTDMYQIMKRRVYDISATTDKKVKIFFNDEEITGVSNFRNYIDLFYKNTDKKILYKEFNERWSIGLIYDPDGQFDHMTFVNKINTFKGGTHLNYIVNQIVDKITQKIVAKDKKNNIKVKPSQIKDNIAIFINSSLEDPDFSSQSKEFLTTKSSKFKIKCDIDSKYIDEFCKSSGIVNDIFEISKIRHENELGKSDGKKKTSINNIAKLQDANFAGSDKSSECTLIITEGDSALSSAIAGIEVIGNDYFGALPLKGKILNVKKATTQKILDNTELTYLKQILGLKHGVVYNDTKSLRYGSVLCLTDQDFDGFHIKGLFISYIHTYWPSLLKIKGFIKSLATPIVKIFKASDPIKEVALHTFYTQTEFKVWKNSISKQELAKNYIKYYKGLGTSTTEEARESFQDYKNKIIDYIWDENEILSDNLSNIEDNEKVSEIQKKKKNTQYDINKLEKSDRAIIIAFADSYEDERKKLVKNYNPDVIIENNQKEVTYSEFAEKELNHYSHYNVMRSVPNICDGFKPSHRKILYGTFLRKLERSETKVAQLSGFISDNTGYHHGEVSLQEAIVGMAQNFIGSNNINLLHPAGTFGSRRLGGKDHASARYIFTKNGELLRIIYPVEDEPILEHIDDENEIVEPHVYYPIIPMILVNGTAGIGTGYSSTIPQYNPKDLVESIRYYLNKHEKYDDKKMLSKFKELIPWYKGFTGKIEKIDDYTFKTYGCFETINENQVRITELPVGKWTQDYIDYLVSLINTDTLITDYKSNGGVYKINIVITFKNNILQALIKSDTLLSELKLSTTLKTSNMHLCNTTTDETGSKIIKIHKYETANEILINYIKLRYDAYIKRKKYYILVLENDLNVLENRRRFIECLCSRTLIIDNKTKEEINQLLIDNKFLKLSTNINSAISYDYLTGLPIYSLGRDKILEHQENINKKSNELEIYRNTTIENLWISDLDKFDKNYDKYYDEYIKKINKVCVDNKSNSKTKTKSKSSSKSKKK